MLTDPFIIFASPGLISIAIQTAGAGVAAVELRMGEASAVGTNTMAARVCIQIASMFAFVFLAGDFLWKAMHDLLYRDTEEAHVGNVPLLASGLNAAATLVLIRCFFRAVELSRGYDDYLFVHEGFFHRPRSYTNGPRSIGVCLRPSAVDVAPYHSIIDRFDTYRQIARQALVATHTRWAKERARQTIKFHL